MLLSKAFSTDQDIDIKNIMFDSRRKLQDSIFFAMKGKINDGHRFIGQAVANGAVCIIHSDPIKEKEEGVVYIKTDDVTKAYAAFCNAFYDHPLDRMNTIGITGTNGKTTIAWLLRDIISHFDRCGYIGTMGYYYGEKVEDSNMNLTTPKSDELFRIGRKMADYGCKVLVLEASSEGLLTRRLEDVSFSTAVFNNLSSDHMDIHGDMEAYFMAKCLLFDKLKEDGKAIINVDDRYGRRLADMLDGKIVTYGIENECDYQAVNIALYSDHTEFDLRHEGKTYHVRTNLIASFNVYNLLSVIAVLNENGYGIDSIMPYLSGLELTPGRCQMIDEGQDFNVVVDFAFTENSFVKVFDYAESITEESKKIIAVFGAAGDRDHKRRPATSKIADERADIVILTYDDPVSEDMGEILNEMKTYFHNIEPVIILDRVEAINEAIKLADSGDTVLLLGKGSDRFFLEKEGRVPYISDEVAARNAIRSRFSFK